MGWLDGAAFVAVLASVAALWWVDGHLMRHPGESWWQYYVAVKNGRPHVWSVFGPSLYLLAVGAVATQTNSGWWLTAALPAYAFLFWKLRTRRNGLPRPPREPGASAHFDDGPSGNVHVVGDVDTSDRM